MSGPEHYLEAERLIQIIEDGNAIDTMLTIPELIGMAQVHATLAEAAATALVANEDPPPSDAHAWWLVAGTKPSKGNEDDGEVSEP
jgi:hypothetical protein